MWRSKATLKGNDRVSGCGKHPNTLANALEGLAQRRITKFILLLFFMLLSLSTRSSKKQSKTSLDPSSQRKVAICYIRQSWTRNADDKHSPERQLSNILAVCQKEGWIPEVYEDTDGHKSGRDVKNRPGWQNAEKRLSDSDVVALVGNDLSRFHRSGWRVGQLVELTENNGIRLVLAAPGRELDTSTPMGIFFIYLTALFDEYYAQDISARAKDMAAHRKAHGKSMGKPPFGTRRNSSGYLERTDEGAWWLGGVRYIKGTSENPPQEDAVWRYYSYVAEFVLRTYVKEGIGTDLLATRMNELGMPFCDRQGNPRPFREHDTRRIVRNFLEYGGGVSEQSAKDRSIDRFPDLDNIPFVPERAVFELDLLTQVAKTLKKNSRQAFNHGQKQANYPYPLSLITRCSHCEKLVQEHSDKWHRTKLTGSNKRGINGENDNRIYRHHPGVKCGCSTKSVSADVYEADFSRLIKNFAVSDYADQQMKMLAAQSVSEKKASEENPAFTRKTNIEKIQRKQRNIKTMFAEDEISEDEYRRRLEDCEQDLAYWQNYTTDAEQLVAQIQMCIDTVDTIAKAWDIAEPAEKQRMARNLFEYITYNLDTQRIEDFRLKPWADQFLVLRAALYTENENAPTQELERDMPHTGFEPVFKP